MILAQQDGTQLVDQCRALPHQPIAGTVQALYVELLFALQLDEAHRRAGGGSDVAFGGIIRFQRDF